MLGLGLGLGLGLTIALWLLFLNKKIPGHVSKLNGHFIYSELAGQFASN